MCGIFAVTPRQQKVTCQLLRLVGVCEPLTPHYNQSNIHEILYPDEGPR